MPATLFHYAILIIAACLIFANSQVADTADIAITLLIAGGCRWCRLCWCHNIDARHADWFRWWHYRHWWCFLLMTLIFIAAAARYWLLRHATATAIEGLRLRHCFLHYVITLRYWYASSTLFQYAITITPPLIFMFAIDIAAIDYAMAPCHWYAIADIDTLLLLPLRFVINIAFASAIIDIAPRFVIIFPITSLLILIRRCAADYYYIITLMPSLITPFITPPYIFQTLRWCRRYH